MGKAIQLDAGAFRWHLVPELLHDDPHGSAAKLFQSGGPPLVEWQAAGHATVIKQAPHRTVYRVVLPGLDFHLKQYRLADARAWLRELVRPSKARLEWERTLAVAERGVPTVEPLALGELGEACDAGGSASGYLATRTLAGAVPLNAFLEATLPNFSYTRRTRVRQRLAVALGELLAHMHDAGVTQHDLHPGNVLLRLDDDVPRLHLIDLYAVDLGEPLTWEASRANLVIFNRWFMLRSERSDRLRFWHAYHRSRRHIGGVTCFTGGAEPAEHAVTVRDLERDTLASNVRFWRTLDKRCLGTNRYFRAVQAGDVAGHVVTDLPAECLRPFLDDPDEPFRREGVQVLKQSPSSAVIALDLPGPDGPRRVIYKRFAVTHWTDPLVALVRRTPALRSYVLGHGLRLRCLPTPRPLGVWHRYRYGLPQEGYLLTEAVPDATELHEFVKQLLADGTKTSRVRLRVLIDQLARLVGTLHHRHLSHRDLKASNVLVSKDQLTFIDLVGVTRHRKVRRSRRIQNLARLNASSAGCVGLTRTDKLRFLRVYLRWGLRGRAGWKRWWREVEQATAEKIDRNRRKGRPLG